MQGKKAEMRNFYENFYYNIIIQVNWLKKCISWRLLFYSPIHSINFIEHSPSFNPHETERYYYSHLEMKKVKSRKAEWLSQNKIEKKSLRCVKLKRNNLILIHQCSTSCAESGWDLQSIRRNSGWKYSQFIKRHETTDSRWRDIKQDKLKAIFSVTDDSQFSAEEEVLKAVKGKAFVVYRRETVLMTTLAH